MPPVSHNLRHKALANWSLAVKATENALKRLQTIGGSNCSNEAYVTTQLANADEYLSSALEHIRALNPPGKRKTHEESLERELARTFAGYYYYLSNADTLLLLRLIQIGINNGYIDVDNDDKLVMVESLRDRLKAHRD